MAIPVENVTEGKCRKWGVKCSNDQEKYGRKATCHPERNASGVEGSSDSVKMRCERMLAFWAFPCPRARSGYILGATAFATLAAHLLERSLACASLRHTVVTIPNEIYLYKTTTNIQICSCSLKTFQPNSEYLNIFRISLKFLRKYPNYTKNGVFRRFP